MINLHNNTITTNKRKLYFLLTIYFLTLTNIPNIILSYDNDVFATAIDSSRGNYVRFSQEEDDRLKKLVAMYGTNWPTIAEQMPGRDAKQCADRWNHHLKHPAIKKEPFTQEEDNRLKELVAKHGTKNWSFIAKQMGNERAPRSYRERWVNNLSLDITKKGPFTQEEDELLMQKFQEFGTKWTTIAKYFSGRIPTSLKNRYDQMLRKGTIPVTQKQVVQQNLQVIDNTKDNTDFEFDFSDGMFDSFDNDYN